MNATIRNLLVSVGLALLGLVLVTSYVSSQRRDIVKGEQEVTVLVAARTIPAGTQAAGLEGGGWITTRRVRTADAVPHAMSRLDTVKDLQLNTDVHTGTQLSEELFAPSRDLQFSRQISGTERLVSIAMDSSGGVAGDVSAGDLIDVYLLTPASTKPVQVATGVEVLQSPQTLDAKDTAAWKNADDPRVFVLRASDKVATTLLAAEQQVMAANGQGAKLWFLLRPRTGAQDTHLGLPALATG